MLVIHFADAFEEDDGRPSEQELVEWVSHTIGEQLAGGHGVEGEEEPPDQVHGEARTVLVNVCHFLVLFGKHTAYQRQAGTPKHDHFIN